MTAAAHPMRLNRPEYIDQTLNRPAVIHRAWPQLLDRALCYRLNRLAGPDDRWTTANDHVTCSDCLDLIHA
jgi:hypothetical protein